MPSLGEQLINIGTELCGFCTGLLGLEIYYSRVIVITSGIFMSSLRRLQLGTFQECVGSHQCAHMIPRTEAWAESISLESDTTDLHIGSDTHPVYISLSIGLHNLYCSGML